MEPLLTAVWMKQHQQELLAEAGRARLAEAVARPRAPWRVRLGSQLVRLGTALAGPVRPEPRSRPRARTA